MRKEEGTGRKKINEGIKEGKHEGKNEEWKERDWPLRQK
jgi:hypothetical protein